MRNIESNLDSLTDQISKWQIAIEDEMGPLEAKLLLALEQINVKRQAYHGHSFVGNHCKTILKNYGKLCSVLDDHPEEKNKFMLIFSIYAEIQPLIANKNILSEAEIRTVESLCTNFGEQFPILFPEESITRKMHELIFHIPRFIAYHKTLGMFSEEEGESLHNVINQELRSLYCVRDNKQKLELLIR